MASAIERILGRVPPQQSHSRINARPVASPPYYRRNGMQLTQLYATLAIESDELRRADLNDEIRALEAVPPSVVLESVRDEEDEE